MLIGGVARARRSNSSDDGSSVCIGPLYTMSVDPEDPLDKPSFIPTDHLAAVGRIANAWAALELAIDRVTWSLAKVLICMALA